MQATAQEVQFVVSRFGKVLDLQQALLEKTVGSLKSDEEGAVQALSLKEEELQSWDEHLKQTLQANDTKLRLAKERYLAVQRTTGGRAGGGARQRCPTPLGLIIEEDDGAEIGYGGDGEDSGEGEAERPRLSALSSLLEAVGVEKTVLEMHWDEVEGNVKALQRKSPAALGQPFGPGGLCIRHRIDQLLESSKQQREGLRSLSVAAKPGQAATVDVRSYVDARPALDEDQLAAQQRESLNSRLRTSSSAEDLRRGTDDAKRGLGQRGPRSPGACKTPPSTSPTRTPPRTPSMLWRGREDLAKRGLRTPPLTRPGAEPTMETLGRARRQ